MTVFVAYVPVLHEGYRRFFEKYPEPRELYVFGSAFTKRFKSLKKDLRQLDPKLVKSSLDAWGLFESVHIVDQKSLLKLNKKGQKLVMPDEDVTRHIAKKYLPLAKITFDPVFLRWDKHNALKERPVVPAERMTRSDFHRKIIGAVRKEAEKSSDIWRHVGAAIVRSKKILFLAHNQHVPSPHTPYQNGDPRNNFHKGVHIELSTAMHAEAALIASAAKQGVSLMGVDMYVSVFPCPPCAKLIAYAGIKTLYCGGGYGVLDGEEVLKSNGVKIIFVE